MGYLDYAGLQYLWGKLKEKFASKSHSHDDRYYTEAEMDGKLNSKVNNNEAGANGLFSKLTTSWTATPTDNTYFIRQDTGGGNEFGRVKFSTLWNYIKGKTDGVYQPKGSYAASGHTHDDRYYTETEIDTKLNGKAPNGHTHQYLSLYGARPANINFTKSTNGTGAMFHFVATSSTTTGKPPADSSILQLNWDNSGGWDSQLALSTAANPHVYYRNQQNGTWGNWSTLLDNLNYTDYAAKKEHTHTKSQITDFPSSLKNPTALTIQTNGTTAAIYDGSAAKTVNITKSNIGLSNVDNTADANKSVKYATSAGNASKVNNHTVNIDVPANAKFTDTTYGVATASSNGLMSSTDKTKLDDFSRVISIQKQIKLTTDWQDTGIAGNNLETGTYIIQVSGFNSSYTQIYSEMYSGIMTWYASETNDLNNDEIFLHNAGHASNSNDIYLRTSRRLYSNGGLHLQIACKVAASGTDTLTFKFRRLI